VIAYRLVVHGGVQGVGYRYAMIAAAQSLGVAGWVRNRRDGTVDALVQGEPGAVEQIVAWCRRGPPAARVSGVDCSAAAVEPALDGFDARPTE